MPVSSRYLTRETVGNLSRNPVMTVAAIVTMLVSLSALGSALIMRQAINRQAIMWRGGVQVVAFLSSDATSNQQQALNDYIKGLPEIKTYHFVDKPAALKEFRVMFANDPTYIQVMNLSTIPASFRIVPRNPSEIQALGRQLVGQPGIHEVTDASQVIGALQHRFTVLRDIAIGLAIGVMIGAVSLIVNTIQLAIFARRREVAVMKLVGATNWFIRIPFMLEGAVHGVVGGIGAFVVVYFTRGTIASFIGNNSYLSSSHTPYATGHDAVMTGIVLLVVGAIVGVLGSAFAVRRFLQV